MNEQDLAAIEARANAATAGPWMVGENDSEQAVMSGKRAVLGFPMEFSYGGDLNSFYSASGEDEDLSFAAHARTDIPALVAEVRRLRGLVKQAFEEGHGGMGVAHPELRKTWWQGSDARAALGDG